MDVLVVDDDAIWREFIGRALEKAGYNITAAANGAEATALASENSFDFVITDVFMPEKEGIEVINEIRQWFPGIRIIAISSNGSAGHTSYLRMAEAFGANISLQKPFTPAQLLDSLRIASRYKPSEIVPAWDRPARGVEGKQEIGGRYEHQ